MDCASKLYPCNFEKSRWEHLNSRFKKKVFGNMFLHCKVAITTTLSKLRIFQDSSCMSKTLKIKMWKCLFYKNQRSFFHIECAPNVFKFFVSFIILHKKGLNVLNHPKLSLHAPYWSLIFKFLLIIKITTSQLNVIIGKNKFILDYIIGFDAKKFKNYYIMGHIWSQN